MIQCPSPPIVSIAQASSGWLALRTLSSHARCSSFKCIIEHSAPIERSIRRAIRRDVQRRAIVAVLLRGICVHRGRDRIVRGRAEPRRTTPYPEDSDGHRIPQQEEEEGETIGRRSSVYRVDHGACGESKQERRRRIHVIFFLLSLGEIKVECPCELADARNKSIR